MPIFWEILQKFASRRQFRFYGLRFNTRRVHGSCTTPVSSKPVVHAPDIKRTAPYWFIHSTRAKDRWVHRELLDILSSEFRSSPVDYHRFALQCGMITVNGVAARPDTIIQNDDLIQNTVHRHEPPVTSTTLKVVRVDKERNFIVVDKPGSIVIHPAGRFYINTLKNILAREFGYETVYPVNRLDRLTSGLMIIPTSVEYARKLAGELKANTVQKEYLARCLGKFPEQEVVCSEPLLRIEPRIGLVIAHPKGQVATTVFKRVRYDASTDSSLVLCKPVTGRSHQIRVHLQYLGHPIANDPIYADTRIWGNNLARGGIDIAPRESSISLDSKSESEGHNAQGRLFETTVQSGEEHPPTKYVLQDTGQVIVVRSPVKLSDEAVHVLFRIWALKTKSEDWSHWKEFAIGTLRPIDERVAGADMLNGAGALMHPKGHLLHHDHSTIVHESAPFSTATALPHTGSAPFLDPSLLLLPPYSSNAGPLPTQPMQPHCPECYIPLLPDPKPESLYIFLHALRYTTSAGSFETGMPHWSREDWVWDRS